MNGEMKSSLGWWDATRTWVRNGLSRRSYPPRIGLALGGGFARGIAHVGVLRVLEQNNIPISVIGGVSSGAIVAAAMASGACADEIEQVALSMKFRDIARWTLNLMGLAGSDRMITFLTRLLKVNRFEDLRIPLAIVATDLNTGRPVTFHSSGDLVMPIRASCAYPGLFLPIRYQGRFLWMASFQWKCRRSHCRSWARIELFLSRFRTRTGVAITAICYRLSAAVFKS